MRPLQQSAVDAAGPQAEKIAALGWFFLGILGVVFLLVMGVMLRALMRRHRGIEQEPVEGRHEASEATEKRLGRVVGVATIVTVAVLFVLFIGSVATGKSVAQRAARPNALTIEVTGNQWWWYVRYLNDDASRIVVTANEIHIPVGRPVMIRGGSHDVIHSFWVPNLNGKIDLIPSRVTTEWLEADQPGRYRGQCAEFCGMQHAHMALWIVAEQPAEFEKWMQRQLAPSIAPADASKQRGQEVFMNHACVYCHAIQGTTAAGQTGPDLTHIGSRLTLAAGTLPNTRGNMGGWIVDPQTLKPGNHMASVEIPPEDLEPLIDYLESLK